MQEFVCNLIRLIPLIVKMDPVRCTSCGTLVRFAQRCEVCNGVVCRECILTNHLSFDVLHTLEKLERIYRCRLHLTLPLRLYNILEEKREVNDEEGELCL